MSDDEEQEIIKEPPKEDPGKRFFLSHANTYEGMALYKELYNRDTCRDPELAAHSFIGTVNQVEKTPRGNFQEPPTGMDQLVTFGRTKEFRETLLSCDVIVYDLMSNDYEEVDYVIKTLKATELSEPKTLVLLSSVMTWVNTPPKFTEERPEGEDAEEAEPEAEEEEEEEEEKPEGEEPAEQLDENGEPIVRAKPLFFKESDHHLRVPHAKYEHLKTLETLAMSSTNT